MSHVPILKEAPGRDPRPEADTPWAHRRQDIPEQTASQQSCLRFSSHRDCSRSSYLLAIIEHRRDALENPP